MKERERFEKWLTSLPIKPDLTMSGGLYDNKHVHSRWVGWQAAKSDQAEELAKERERLSVVCKELERMKYTVEGADALKESMRQRLAKAQARNAVLKDAIKGLDDAFCSANDTKDERHKSRLALIAALRQQQAGRGEAVAWADVVSMNAWVGNTQLGYFQVSNQRQDKYIVPLGWIHNE